MIEFFKNKINDIRFLLLYSDGIVVPNYSYKYGDVRNYQEAIEDLNEWCKDNCVGYYRVKMGFRHYVLFSRKSDAALFTLMFKDGQPSYDPGMDYIYNFMI